MTCRYCNKPAKFIPNEEIYNGTRYGKSYMMWYCKGCDAYVGTHENDPKRPLGELANKELREAKKKAHRIVDRYWRSGKLKRGHVYSRLTKYFGEETHIGWADVKRANEISEIAPIILEMSKTEFDKHPRYWEQFNN